MPPSSIDEMEAFHLIVNGSTELTALEEVAFFFFFLANGSIQKASCICHDEYVDAIDPALRWPLDHIIEVKMANAEEIEGYDYVKELLMNQKKGHCIY